MARLASQERLGFFPLPLPVVDLIAEVIQEVHEEAVICDPCAGEGEAVQALANKLGLDESRIVACELHEGRSRALKARLPTAVVTERTDFQSSAFYTGRASMLYLNPPYDHELGHSARSEQMFLAKATTALRPGGLLAFVLPRRVLMNTGPIKLFLHNWFQNIGSFDFPKEVRKFDECVVLAQKRKKAKTDRYPPWQFPMLNMDLMWQANYKLRPGELFEFRKVAYDDQELRGLMDFEQVVEDIQRRHQQDRKQVRPPLTLGEGHVALLLAAGYLNGRIHKPGEPPHVVRGTSRKGERVKETSRTSDNKHERLVIEEKIELVIRTLDQQGNIRDIVDTSTEDQVPEEYRGDTAALARNRTPKMPRGGRMRRWS
ncbi:MAG: DUF6094 domain-containing protein [bacterium]|nr:DUF6094 domain-containing protein [bacterium]